MWTKKCNCLLKRVMFYINKMFLWFLKRVLKVTLFQIVCTIVFLSFFAFIRNLAPSSDITLKIQPTNPVILWWTEGFPGTSETKYCPNNIQCDVYSVRNMSKHFNVEAYLFYGSNILFNDLPLPRRPKDVIWGLYHEESPRNVEELMHEPILNLFNFSSTYSRHSDVPFPLQYLDSFDDITSRRYYVKTSEKNMHLENIAPILYLQTDCETSTERDLYVKELMKVTQVDSYGTCLNNKQLPEKFTNDYLNNLNDDEFLTLVAKYKFVIAIENGVCDDYITEKFWRAIKVGSVPIYFGSSLIRDWFPNENSAILLEDYPTPTILNNHLNKLLKDDALYEKYLEHKTKQIVTNKRLIKEFSDRPYQVDSLKTVDVFECFVCKKVHDRIRGTSEVSVVGKSHYSCPKPLSALQLDVNSKNSWVITWEDKREKAGDIYNNIMNKAI